MAFVKNIETKIGDWVITTTKHENFIGVIEVGTRVKIISIGTRGYDIEDEYENVVSECGWVI